MAIRGVWALLLLGAAACGAPAGDAVTDLPASTITVPAVPAPTATSTTVAPAPPAFSSSSAPVTASDLSASWRPGCPVPVDELRLVTLTHWGMDGVVHTGRLVVRADLVPSIEQAFGALFDARFPIERMEPVDAYGGSDDASMAANNTSAFNCRLATGGGDWSQHAFGAAIDINPVQNPYVNGTTVLPEAGRAHLDRGAPAPGKILAGDAVVQAFASVGWGWGGAWHTLRDYQHFSASGR